MSYPGSNENPSDSSTWEGHLYDANSVPGSSDSRFTSPYFAGVHNRVPIPFPGSDDNSAYQQTPSQDDFAYPNTAIGMSYFPSIAGPFGSPLAQDSYPEVWDGSVGGQEIFELGGLNLNDTSEMSIQAFGTIPSGIADNITSFASLGNLADQKTPSHFHGNDTSHMSFYPNIAESFGSPLAAGMGLGQGFVGHNNYLSDGWGSPPSSATVMDLYSSEAVFSHQGGSAFGSHEMRIQAPDTIPSEITPSLASNRSQLGNLNDASSHCSPTTVHNQLGDPRAMR